MLDIQSIDVNIGAKAIGHIFANRSILPKQRFPVARAFMPSEKAMLIQPHTGRVVGVVF